MKYDFNGNAFNLSILTICVLSGLFFRTSILGLSSFHLSIIALAALLLLEWSFGIQKIYLVLAIALYSLFSISNEGVIGYSVIVLANFLLVVHASRASFRCDRTFKIILSALAIMAMLVFVVYLFQCYKFGLNAIVQKDIEVWAETKQYLFRVNYGRFLAFQGFAINPNVSILPFALLACVFFAFCQSTHLAKVYVIIALIILSLTTNSRSTIIGILAFSILVLVRLFRFKSAVDIRFVFFALILIPIIFAFFNVDSSFQDLVLGGVEKFQTASNVGRYEKWSLAFSSFSNHPFLGVGLSGTRDVLGKSAENTYIEFLAEFGVFGLLLFGIIFARQLFDISKCQLGFPILAMMLAFFAGNSLYVHPCAMYLLGLSANKCMLRNLWKSGV